jgi:hypothetical protein
MCFAVVFATARDTTENPVLCSPRGSFQVGSGIREGWSFWEGEKLVVANEQRAFCF